MREWCLAFFAGGGGSSGGPVFSKGGSGLTQGFGLEVNTYSRFVGEGCATY